MNTLIRGYKKVVKCGYNNYEANTNKYIRTYRSYQKLNRSEEIYSTKVLPITHIKAVRIARNLNPAITSPLVQTLNSVYYDGRITNNDYAYQRRNFHLSSRLYEQTSSKVEATIQTIKNKEKEDLKKDATSNISKASASDSKVPETNKPVVIKKSIPQRIWEEILHYYHGFRLLFIDINVCRKLLWRVLKGKSLTRRENRLLVRTTSDLFRLVPFSVFIIIPFMELLLPVFIKFFPGMLPSTFQTTKERENKLKQSLSVKLEVAKFLQKTLDEMAVQHKDHKSEEAKQFAEFFEKIKNPNEYVSAEDIIKFSKRFEDEITLDSLSREQLVALCRVLDLNTLGTTNFLRFQLRMKLRNLSADDKIIQKEGVDALNLYELQLANKNRGMRAYGLSEAKLRYQLQDWIDLSLNEKVPPSLLLLSRALMISEELTTSDQLKDTIRSLPDTLAAQTKAAIGELEGKIDNKTKIEIIKEEVRKIKEEREEEKEEAEEKAREEAEILVDKAKELVDIVDSVQAQSTSAEAIIDQAIKIKDSSISSQDVQLLNEALDQVSENKKQLLKEKETIKELKEEIEDYKEDIEELQQMTTAKSKSEVKESRAAKRLYNKVNSMIGNLDKVLTDLEKKGKQISEDIQEIKETEIEKKKEEELVRIDDLVDAIKGLKKVSDETRLTAIENVLSKIDADKDGHIKVDDVMKVIEAIGKENIKLNEKQLEELVELLDKEEYLEAEDKIEKALAKSMKETNKENPADQLVDKAPVLTDNAEDLEKEDNKHIITKKVDGSINGTESLTADAVKEASDKQKEKIISSTNTTSIPPPQIPPSSSTNSKDKTL